VASSRIFVLSLLLMQGVLGCRSGNEPSPNDPPDDGPSYEDDTYRFEGAPSKLPSEFETSLPSCGEVLTLPNLPIRLFADDGHLFYFEISPQAARAGDEKSCKESPPPSGVECPNFADNVRVMPFGMDVCADTGKIEVDLRGGPNFRPWLHIPTINFDSGEFEPLKFGQGDSQLRFQNGQRGRTILREAVALRLWRALGFPAPESSFVKTQSNIWDTAVGPGTWAAHLMIQRYKKAFFDQNMPDALHVWEGEGDPFSQSTLAAAWKADCEWSSEDDCDTGALQTVATAIRAAKKGAGFYEATADLIDWPSVHAFQCLSALTDNGTDWIHKNDNVVLVLTTAGQIRYLPYNMDTSGGMLDAEGKTTGFEGSAYIIKQCALDPDCQEAAQQTCEGLLDEYESLDAPSTIVEERCDTLTELDLVRSGDTEACRDMREYYEEAAARLREELSSL
jgi:hypothetical protein